MKYYDTEHDIVLTEEDVRDIFLELKNADPELYDYDFKEYLINCTGKNGTLEEYTDVYEVSDADAIKIIEDRIPLGLFFCRDTVGTEKKSVFVGIDNSGGEAWTEDFTNFEDCQSWLFNGYLSNT